MQWWCGQWAGIGGTRVEEENQETTAHIQAWDDEVQSSDAWPEKEKVIW